MRLSIRASASDNAGIPVRRSVWLTNLQQFFKRPIAVIGLTILLILIAAAVLAPYIAPYDPIKRNFADRFAPPSAQYLFGTDALGRDQFSRVLYGGRVTLYIGISSVLLSMLIGIPLGLISGYFGKWIDGTIMRILDLILAFPGLIFAIWLVSMLGPGISQVIIANAVFSLPIFARLVRGNVLSLRSSEYIIAAQGLGLSQARIVFRHIFPNVVPSIIVLASLNVSGAMLTGAALSYLGLGAQPPTPEWGAMLADGRANLRDAWWVALFPGLILTCTVLACNLVGDALRDVLDPRSVRK
jgi:peptide/nickel transport system permease protein